jgi:hypothetical protein
MRPARLGRSMDFLRTRDRRLARWAAAVLRTCCTPPRIRLDRTGSGTCIRAPDRRQDLGHRESERLRGHRRWGHSQSDRPTRTRSFQRRHPACKRGPPSPLRMPARPGPRHPPSWPPADTQGRRWRPPRPTAVWPRCRRVHHRRGPRRPCPALRRGRPTPRRLLLVEARRSPHLRTRPRGPARTRSRSLSGPRLNRSTALEGVSWRPWRSSKAAVDLRVAVVTCSRPCPRGAAGSARRPSA